jgi:hypothetical protein
MTTQSTQAIVLRDSAGALYVISQEALQAGQVPENKKQALQEALSGDVAGFIFDINSFQNAFTNLSQNNTNLGSNTLIGGFVGANNQSLSQLGINIGSVSSTQLKG